MKDLVSFGGHLFMTTIIKAFPGGLGSPKKTFPKNILDTPLKGSRNLKFCDTFSKLKLLFRDKFYWFKNPISR